MRPLPELDDDDRAIYEWQMWSEGIGEAGQRRLKGASVLVSRVGGVGGSAAYQLAAAGVGRLILVHGGAIRASDLNRQLLMTHGALGSSRAASAACRLRELNPRLELVTAAENIDAANVEGLVAQADLVVDAAPRFTERFLMHREAVRRRIPVVEAAMHDFDAHLTVTVPGRSPCLRCLYPDDPVDWRREFPVFGAVAGTVGSLAAVEAIKLVTGVGEPLVNRMLTIDMRAMSFRTHRIVRDPACALCAGCPPADPERRSSP